MLATAPAHFSSDSNVELILLSAAVVVGIGFLGFIPIQLARSRRHRHSETILGIIVLWGLLSAVSISYCIMQQMNWTASVQESIQEGYYDRADAANKPAFPIPLWCGLGVIYAATTAWAARRHAVQTRAQTSNDQGAKSQSSSNDQTSNPNE
jgi:hypothetical protein